MKSTNTHTAAGTKLIAWTIAVFYWVLCYPYHRAKTTENRVEEPSHCPCQQAYNSEKTLPRLWLLDNFFFTSCRVLLIIKHLTDGLCLISQFILAFSICNRTEWTSGSGSPPPFFSTCYPAGEKVGSKQCSHLQADVTAVTDPVVLSWPCGCHSQRVYVAMLMNQRLQMNPSLRRLCVWVPFNWQLSFLQPWKGKQEGLFEGL